MSSRSSPQVQQNANNQQQLQDLINIQIKQTENAMENLLKKYSLEDASRLIY